MSQAERSRRFRTRHGDRLRAEEKRKRRERRPEAHRLALAVDVAARCEVDDDGCLIWQGAKSHGYGVFSKLGCLFKSHRIAYEQAHGPVPADHDVHHRCEKRACCNADHLTALTVGDHMAEDGRLDALAARASSAARARWG